MTTCIGYPLHVGNASFLKRFKSKHRGDTRVRTRDLSICSRMLYHWAISPINHYANDKVNKGGRLCLLYFGKFHISVHCCDGRVVKALDSKSNGIFPRRFEPCSQRLVLNSEMRGSNSCCEFVVDFIRTAKLYLPPNCPEYKTWFSNCLTSPRVYSIEVRISWFLWRPRISL